MLSEREIAGFSANVMEAAALESCVRILEEYPRLADLIPALEMRKDTIEEVNDRIMKVWEGGEQKWALTIF